MPAVSIHYKQIEKYAKQHQFQAQKRNSPVRAHNEKKNKNLFC